MTSAGALLFSATSTRRGRSFDHAYQLPEYAARVLSSFASRRREIADGFMTLGGTGQLISALKANEIDVAIALTEALITGIVKKTAEYKLVGTYVTSSLNWAVIAGKETRYVILHATGYS